MGGSDFFDGEGMKTAIANLVSVKREVIAGRFNRSYGRWTERPAKTTAPKSLDRKGLILICPT
jgi:hypothetical protein